MRIGICCDRFIGWSGGIDFLRSLLDSITSLGSTDLEIYVLVPDRGPLWEVQRIRDVVRHVVRCARARELRTMPSRPSSDFVSDTLGETRNLYQFHHIDIGHRALAAACHQHRIDVVLPAFHTLGKDFPVPWIGYIYDFQHKHFPQYFDQDELHRRDQSFSQLMADAGSVIVNSKAVANDVVRFIPERKARIVSLPFSAAPGDDWLIERPGVAERYGVAAPYFMISNQFWLHKRHDIAFQAFRMLASSMSDVQLVCTGQTEDNRDPNYFPRLVEYIAKSGLTDRVKILGLIPKGDQIELMKDCVAVVQATAFEGGPGGGSVHDAVALGVPTIVSDIPINRELESWVTTYFRLDDPEALCSAMLEALKRPQLRPTDEHLREQGLLRRRQCGEVLLAVLQEEAGRPLRLR
jgi:glycosyltransferase involved in cell wall biosynthesis